ncbi:MAG: D-alanine--D-alanine ligase [Rhodothermaeota bacterium MED-G19]|nr:MAG: D-alanine--D-alanine ligase [Rhodothermaeota bacterium MED-G19]
MKKNVVILMGGYSSEYDISVKSGEVVFNTLSKEEDLNLFQVIISKKNWKCIDSENSKLKIDKETFHIIRDGKVINVDLVLNTIHGVPGENGEIQLYLENLNIKQTSTGSKESRLTFNKDNCKNKVQKEGYLVPESILVKKNDKINIDNILSKVTLPLFVKPNSGGSSFGISRITEEKDIIKALEICFKEDEQALIEEEIKGREISVGVIKYNDTIISLPPTEIISHNDFFDYDAKYNGESDEITPAKIKVEHESTVKEIALDIYKKLNLKGFSRCDFILRDNKFYFLEVNTNPGLTKKSILPQQANAANISLKNLFRSLID